MALAPADFYAYSRATGVPVPEDPEERAELVPDVLEFRRNQLRAPQQESNLPGILGLAALGLSALAGGAYLLGGRGTKTRQPIPSSPRTPKPSDIYVAQAATPPSAEVYSKLEQEVKPSKVATPPAAIPQATVDLNAFINDPEFQKRLELQEAEEYSLTPEAQAEMRRAARVVQGVESQEKARAKNVLLQLRRDEETAAIPQATVDLEVVAQQNQANDTGIDQAVARVTTQPAQRDLNFTKTGLTPRQQKIMLEFGGVAAPATELNTSEATEQRAAYLAQEALAAQKSKAPTNARALQKLGPHFGLTQEEIFHRISASASDYRPGTMDQMTQLDIAALLDPEVPTSAVSDLLGTTLSERGGRVGRNLTYEVPEAGGGMTGRGDVEVIGEFGSDVLAYNPRTGNYDIDLSPDLEAINTQRGRTSDYDTNAADYGDVEGPGGFVETRAFKERTNKGTTMVPGQVSNAEAMASGSLRQERELDVVLPTRMTLEGDVAQGFFIDPETGRLRLEGASRRIGTPRQGVLETSDINVEGSKLVGGYQPSVPHVSNAVSTQPLTAYRDKVVKGFDNRLYETSGQEVVGEEPLVGYRLTKLTKPDGTLLGYHKLGSEKLTNLTLSREKLQSIIEQGNDLYFNNSTAKKAYFETHNPAALATGIQSGQLLSEIGTPLDYQGFLIQHLDNALINQGIDLPVLKQQISKTTGNPYHPAAAHAFVTDLRKTTKDTPVYGKPYALDPEGKRIVKRDPNTGKAIFQGGYVQYETEKGEPRPIPGRYDVRGGGGIDPMTVGDEGADVDVAFFAPRVDTASQRKVMQQAKSLGIPAAEIVGASSTPLGAQMAQIRSGMETKPVGLKVRSPGSFARTQNPYTGQAAAAMGPASRVLSGDYQYPERQLQINVPSPSLVELEYQPGASNMEVVMKQLMAQAGRRAGKRRNR